MSESFDMQAPEHFIAGAVGEPGQRTFYLQAREGGAVVSLKCEKEHVSALAEYLAGLLAQLTPVTEPLADVPALLEPLEAAWAVGSIGVGYDGERDRIIVEATELLEDDETEGGATARFRISRAQAAAFVQRARALMKAGRPSCPLCAQPLGGEPHVCPRTNGHHAGRV